MADLLDKEQFEAEKDLAAWKELQASILQALWDTIKGLFPGAEIEEGQGLTVEKKNRDQNQNLEIEQPLAVRPETSPTPGYTQLYGNGVNNLTPENIKAIHAILRSYTGDTIIGGEGLIIKFNGRTLYETDETGKIITHTGISHELRDRLEAIQPGAKSAPAQVQPAQSSAVSQAMDKIADETAKDIAAKNAAKQKANSPDKKAKNTIEEAITFLASQDDGTKKADGKGFNADDSYFGNKLAKDIADGATTDTDRAELALDLLQKYSRQLSTGGYSLPKWDDVKDQYPPKTIATDLSKEAAQERLANSMVLPPNFNTEERRAANQEPASHIVADPLGLLPPLRTKSSRLDDSEPPEIPEPDAPIDAIRDEVDDSLDLPFFRSTEPLATLIPPEVEAPSLVEQAEPATSEPIAEESLEIPAFRGTRETTRPVRLPEDISTRAVAWQTPEPNQEVEDRSATPVAYPGFRVASPPELPTAPAVLDPVASTMKPEPEVEAVVAPMEPEVPAPRLSIGQKISQKITDAAKDAAKTVTDAVVSKIKSDIEATTDAVVRPVTDAIKSKAQESISFTAGVFKETIDDAVNLAGNTAENFKNAIGIKPVGDLSLINKYHDAVRSISAGIVPESKKEIAETIDKSADAVKGMFDEIQENDQAAEAEQLNEVAIAEQAMQERLKEHKQLKVLFQIFSLNTNKEHNTPHGRQGVVDFPNGAQLSTSITDQGVASISLIENGKISELGSYNAKTREYELGKDLKDSAASLQQLKEHVNLDFTIRPSTAKEVAEATPAAISIPPDSVVKETVAKPPTEKPQIRADKLVDERTLLDAEIEGQLIAKIVLEPDALNKAVEQGITDKSFDFLVYQEAFKAAQQLAAEGKPTDLKSVVDELKNEQFTKIIVNDIQAEQQVSTDYLAKAVSAKEFKHNTLNVASAIKRDAYSQTPINQITAKSVDLINSARDGKTVAKPEVAFSPPPQPLNNVASEQKVVAALITAPNLYQEAVSAGLTNDSFTNPQTKKIFEAVAELSAEKEEVNIRSVRSRLDDPEDKLLASNLSISPALPTVAADIKTVIDLSTRRDLVKAADRLTDAAYDPKSSKQSLKSDLEEAKIKMGSPATNKQPQPPTATVKEEPVVREKNAAVLEKMAKTAGKPAMDSSAPKAIETDAATKKATGVKAKKDDTLTAEKKTTTTKKVPKATVLEDSSAKRPPVATVQSEPSKSKGGR